MTDSTLSQIARKMAEQTFFRCKHSGRIGLSGNQCSECRESAIREAMLLALQKAEQRIKEMLSDSRPYEFSQHVELAIKASAAEVTQLKSELIPSTSPDEKG